MIAGVATETIVVSTRIMKKPMQRANSAGHGSFPPVGSVVLEGAGWLTVLPNTPAWTIAPMSTFNGPALMAGPPPTLLPEDPAAADLVPGADVLEVVARHPDSPLAWSTLAAMAADQEEEMVTVYA